MHSNFIGSLIWENAGVMSVRDVLVQGHYSSGQAMESWNCGVTSMWLCSWLLAKLALPHFGLPITLKALMMHSEAPKASCELGMPWDVREGEKLVQTTVLGEVLKSGGTGLCLLRGRVRAVALLGNRSIALNVGGSSTVAMVVNWPAGRYS